MCVSLTCRNNLQNIFSGNGTRGINLFLASRGLENAIDRDTASAIEKIDGQTSGGKVQFSSTAPYPSPRTSCVMLVDIRCVARCFRRTALNKRALRQ
jgi:hypothetical protein